MDWRQPKEWQFRERLTAQKMNTELRDKLLYLKDRPRVEGQIDETTTTTSTDWVAVDDRLLHVTLGTKGGDIWVSLQVCTVNFTLHEYVYYDVWVDDSYYLSSGDATPGTGLLSYRTYTVPYYDTISAHKLLQGLATGEHTFSLHWKVSAGTGYLYATSIYPPSLIVKEF